MRLFKYLESSIVPHWAGFGGFLFCFSFAGNAKFLTAFSATCRQYFATIGSFHTLTKTMHRFTAAFMWLIGSFFTWHNLKFFPFKNDRGETGYLLAAGTPLPTVCERTAKVGVELQILGFGF